MSPHHDSRMGHRCPGKVHAAPPVSSRMDPSENLKHILTGWRQGSKPMGRQGRLLGSLSLSLSVFAVALLSGMEVSIYRCQQVLVSIGIMSPAPNKHGSGIWHGFGSLRWRAIADALSVRCCISKCPCKTHVFTRTQYKSKRTITFQPSKIIRWSQKHRKTTEAQKEKPKRAIFQVSWSLGPNQALHCCTPRRAKHTSGTTVRPGTSVLPSVRLENVSLIGQVRSGQERHGTSQQDHTRPKLYRVSWEPLP